MTRTSTPTHALKEQDLSALQRDADRYRWLRHDAKVSAVTVGALRDKYHLRTLLAGDLDAVLDAARPPPNAARRSGPWCVSSVSSRSFRR